MDASLSSFRVGDKVVYPNHGVGIIEHISSRTTGELRQEFYLLKIEASNLRVMVPLTNVGSVGMRPVAASCEVAAILRYLEDQASVVSPADWKFRFKENSDKMRAGTLLQIAEVLKGLLQLHRDKPLSFREKKMLDRAAALLLGELASANGLQPGQALTQLQETLSKAALVLPPPDAAA